LDSARTEKMRAKAESFKGWLLADRKQLEMPGLYQEKSRVSEEQSWYKVMCLTGVDYFSTLGYQPGIAALAAGMILEYPRRALASGLYRPHWRRSDSSFARDCRRCARYSAHSRQTALTDSVFAGSVNKLCVFAIGLHTLNAIMHSLRSDLTMKIVTPLPAVRLSVRFICCSGAAASAIRWLELFVLKS
jgi:hypothetical protein